MTDVEIIYIKRERNNQNDYTKPEIKIYSNQNEIATKNPNNTFVKKETKKPNFNIKRTSYLIACLVITGIILTSSFNAGYLPIKQFLEIKEPIGISEEIDIKEAIEKYSLPLDSIPSFDGVNYKIYATDQIKPVIEADYKDELTTEGFNLKYMGVKNIKGFDLYYYGFIKGITAVFIIINTDQTYNEDYKTLVLYSTGNVFDYAEILKDNSGLLKL